MKVLSVLPWYKPSSGGVVTAVDRMNRGLISKGHQAVVLIDGVSDRVEHVTDDESVPVYSTRMRYFYWHGAPIKGFVAWLVFLIPTVLRLRRFIKEQQIDIVAVHFPGAWAIHFLLLRTFFSVRYIVCVHGTDVHLNLLEHWSTRLGTGLVICRADCLVSCSESLLLTARHNLRRKPRRTRVIYNGLSPEWGEVPVQTGSNTPYIVSQGFPLEVKGGDVLVKAFAAIALDYPKVRLKIIGQGDHETLSRLITQLGVGGQIDLAGLIPPSEIPTVFQQSLFGVIASRREGLPLAAMELQYLRRPVIATEVGGIPECIEHGVTGFLVPSENAVALADRMRTLLDSESLRSKMGEAGRRLICDKFQIGRTVDSYLELFRQIAGVQAGAEAY